MKRKTPAQDDCVVLRLTTGEPKAANDLERELVRAYSELMKAFSERVTERCRAVLRDLELAASRYLAARTRQRRQAGGSASAARNREAARTRAQRLASWAANFPRLSAPQLQARLSATTAAERERLIGAREVPSVRAIQRARKSATPS